MSDHFEDAPVSGGQNSSLAQWLFQLLAQTPRNASTDQIAMDEDDPSHGADYHVTFYPQIPDFALALLKKEKDVPLRYAPLLFHLIGCPTCHRAYLEMYDALKATQSDVLRSTATALRIPSLSAFATTSPRWLVFLCQLLISEARAVLRQAHREQSDQDSQARSLLQQAIGISRYIMQGTLRQRALRDLVEVAGLYTVSSTPVSQTPTGPAELSYGSLVGSGSGARGKPVMRRAEMMSRPNGPISIDLRANSLEGTITQQGEQLVLHLIGLDESLRGKRLLISVPLGTLLEPIRWLGGNPLAIRSTVPVDANGGLTTSLGSTDLHLENAEERNLVETLFKKLDIRSLD